MVISDVRIRRLSNDGKMRAIVSVTFNDEFVVHDIRIIEGGKGLFVAMPSKRTPAGEFRDIAHPISADSRMRIEQAVIDAYLKETQSAALEA